MKHFLERNWKYAALMITLGPILFSVVGLHRYQRTWVLLNRIDAVIETEPAQALHLLDSLDRNRLYDASQRAKFALLYTQAQDKNYIDETDDSLIRIAVDYYEQRNNLRDKFRSLYYLGRVQFNQCQYSRAMVSFMEAEQLKDNIDDDALLGRLYTQMGSIYKIYYDYPKALCAYQTSYQYYINTSLLLHQNSALLDIGLVYGYMKQYDKSEQYYYLTLQMAKDRKDSYLIETCYGSLIIQYSRQHRFLEAWHLYDSLILNGIRRKPSTAFLGSLAAMYTYKEDYTSSKENLKTAIAVSKSKLDSINLYYYQASISRQNGDYKMAYEYLENNISLQDSVMRQVLQQPILSTQRDFLANKLEYQAYKAQTARKIRYYYISIALFAILFLYGFLVYRLKRKDALIHQWMMMYHDLEETTWQYQTEAREKIDSLFKVQFTTINNLAKIYYNQSGDAKREQFLFWEIRRQLEDAKSPQKLKELEAIINEYKFDAMRLLREEFPRLKERDYRELCYHFAGFGITFVSVMMNDNHDNIYKRRQRYRARFAKSNAPHRELFMSILGTKSKESDE